MADNEARDGPDPVASLYSAVSALCLSAVVAVGADGGSLAVLPAMGRGGTAYASDETAAAVDELQLTLGEGPAVDAFRGRHPVHVADLSSADAGARWVAFSREASSAGVGALSAFPLHLDATVFGVMSLYRREPGELSRVQLAAALNVADEAVGVVLDRALALEDLGTPRPGAGLSRGPGDEGYYRSVTHQASGQVMVQLGVSIDERWPACGRTPSRRVSPFMWWLLRSRHGACASNATTMVPAVQAINLTPPRRNDDNRG